MANNGQKQARIAYKQTPGGAAVDADGELARVSGKRQAIAILQGYANPDPLAYEVVDTFEVGGYVEGTPTVIIDFNDCPLEPIAEKDLILRGEWAENGVIDEATFRESLHFTGFDIQDFEVVGNLVKANINYNFEDQSIEAPFLEISFEECLFLKEIIKINTEALPPTNNYKLLLYGVGVGALKFTQGVEKFGAIVCLFCAFDLAGYASSEPFAQAMNSDPGGEFSFQQNNEPVDGTNFEAILLAKGKEKY